MNDHELDRMLNHAVNVDHSAEFLVRVRGRVAQEQDSPGGGLRWLVAASSVAVVLLVALTVSWRAREAAPARPSVVVQSTDAPIEQRSATRAIDGPAVAQPAAVRRQTRNRRAAVIDPATTAFPEILISPEDARAFEVFVAYALENRLPSELSTDTSADSAPLVVSRIEIPPLAIEPLQAPTRLEGDRR